MLTFSQKEFNDEVQRAIDGIICGIVGRDVLNSLHNYLKTQYGITPDELPYRTDTLFEILEHTFGMLGAKTLTRAIAREVYYRHNIDFRAIDGYTLQDYLEEAKRILQQVAGEISAAPSEK